LHKVSSDRLLTGTLRWQGEQKSEGWDPAKSTILQVIVSLLGLVLVKEPYYNEAGYETRVGSAESASVSQHYSEKAYYSCRGFIEHAIQNHNDVWPMHWIIVWLYYSTEEGAPRLLDVAIKDLKVLVDIEDRSQVKIGGLDKVSKGALIIFRRRLNELEVLREKLSQNWAPEEQLEHFTVHENP
jgi:ubiquitin-conjugating enzyme E2 O